MPVDLIFGPQTREMTRTAAEQALLGQPDFPKDAEYTIQAHAGQWVAAIHQAAPPFAPADDDEESPGPKSEGPDDTGPDDSGPPSDVGPSDDADSDDGGDAGPPAPKKEKSEKGGEKGEIHQLMSLLHQIADALGIAPDAGPGPVPGPDGDIAPPGPPPPHGGPPPGAGAAGPPGHGGKGGLLGERPLKPGEVPPGGTPVGAPAFASVDPRHPWAHTIGKIAHFKVAERIDNQSLAEIESELQAIARAGGFTVDQFRPVRGEDGNRYVEATIRTPQVAQP